MNAPNAACAVEVGERAGDAQHPVIAARGDARPAGTCYD